MRHIQYNARQLGALLYALKILVCFPVRSHFTLHGVLNFLLLLCYGSMFKILQITLTFYAVCKDLLRPTLHCCFVNCDVNGDIVHS